MENPHTPPKRKKRLILFFFTGIAIILIIYITTLYNTKNKGTVTSGGLSQRSQEFLKQQKQAPESELFTAQFDEQTDTTAGTPYNVDGCFTVVAGSRVTNSHNNQKCSITLTLEDPRAHLTAFLQEGSYATLDDVSGVKMRRLDTDKYKETARTVAGRKYAVFRVNDTSLYEATAFSLFDGAYFAISLSANTNEDLDSKLLEVIGTVKFP